MKQSVIWALMAMAMMVTAQAQPAQPPDPAAAARILAITEQQRNAFLTAATSAEARLATALEEIAKLRAEIDALKKKSDPAADNQR